MKSQLEVGPVKSGKVSHCSIGGNTSEPEIRSQETRLRGGSFIESCEGEKFSNSCDSGVTFMSVTIR